jgi:hypothetical protein
MLLSRLLVSWRGLEENITGRMLENDNNQDSSLYVIYIHLPCFHEFGDSSNTSFFYVSLTCFKHHCIIKAEGVWGVSHENIIC